MIGFSGQGGSHIRGLIALKNDVDIMALCDVDKNVMAKGMKLAMDSGATKEAEAYGDIRKLLVDKKHLLCLEGKRACPPEDCGGPWGYVDYLAAIADADHEQHEEMLEWRRPFRPEAFDPKKATREMRKMRKGEP